MPSNSIVSLVFAVDFVIKTSSEVLSVACSASGGLPSQIAAKTIVITSAPKVEITLSFGGSLTAADVTTDVETKPA